MKFTQKQIEGAGKTLEYVIKLFDCLGDTDQAEKLMPLAQIVASARVRGSETLEVDG